MTRPDFRVKTFFTPQIIPGLGYAQGWKDAFELAYLNITTPGVDTIPAVHQYVRASEKHDFDSGLRAPISYIEIAKHFILGSQAAIVVESLSDRDFFEVVPNETVSFRTITGITKANPVVVTSSNHQLQSGTNIRITGVLGMDELNNKSFRIEVNDADRFHLHLVGTLQDVDSTLYGTYTSGGQVSYGGGDVMPPIKFPYRAWEINLKGKDDANFPTIPLFRGMRTRIQPVVLGDKRIEGVQDAVFRRWIELKSFDAWNLMMDRGVSLWHQRANNKSDGYHLQFNTGHHITFDDAIVRIVEWMNMGRPTVDFPITYSYTPKGTSPYNRYLDEITFDDPQTIVNTADASTWEALTSILNYMGGLQGEGRKFVPTLTVNEAGTIGTINVELGGFDKTEVAYENFRTNIPMQRFYYAGQGSPYVPDGNVGNGVAITEPINQVSVIFTKNNPAEYWIQFKLWKWNSSSNIWEVVHTYPDTGYEYVNFDAKNLHNRMDFEFIGQPVGTYTWTADIVCSDAAFALADSGANAMTPAAYALQASNSEIDLISLRTFVQTQGACAIKGASECPDFVSGLCPHQRGLYPDPYSFGGTTLTGILTFTEPEATVTGVGTLFTTELIPGDAIKHNFGSAYYQVKSITNNTELTLGTPGGASIPFIAAPPFEEVGIISSPARRAGINDSNEKVNATYGILGGRLIEYANVSAFGSWNTKCRLNSRRLYECSLNIDSSVREPINVHLEFVDGWTEDLVGKYCEYNEPETNAYIIFRCMQQTHILTNGRLKTMIDGFRI